MAGSLRTLAAANGRSGGTAAYLKFHALRDNLIDRALTTSANKITEAKNHLGNLVAEVEDALAAIEDEIAA